jgi:WASH complex subunit strumpellin
LIDVDEQFKEAYLDIVERFYTLFESIHHYLSEINEFILRVKENYYIDYNIEAIIQEKEGKRLLIEAYYNFGVMILLLDRLIPPIARERMMVCYIRYKSVVGSEYTT